MRSFSRHWWWIILVVALLLRLPGLFGSFWLDEAAQALESVRPWWQQLQIAKDFQPPLLHLLLHLVQYLGTPEWWLRSWGALLPGLLTIYFVYRIGADLKNRTTGLVAAALLATSALHVFYSQELRPYALPAFFATLSWWSLLTPQLKKNRWLIYTLSTIAGLYSSYLYPFLVLSQLVILYKQRLWLKPLIISLTVAAVAFMPWLPFFREQLQVGGQLRQQLPGWENVVSIPALKSPLIVAGKFVFGLGDLDVSLAVVVPFVILVTALLGLLVKLWVSAQKNDRQRLVLFLAWLVIPFLAAWLVTWVIPIVRPKRLLFLLPAWYLVVAMITTYPYRQKMVRRVAQWTLALIVFLNIWGLAQYYHQPQLQRENWRDLHQQILERYPADTSVVVFAFDEPFAPWLWYDGNQYPSLATGVLVNQPASYLSQLFKPVQDKDFILVFDYLRDLTDPDRKIDQELQSLGYQEVDYLDQPLIGLVRVYAKPEAIISQRTL